MEYENTFILPGSIDISIHIQMIPRTVVSGPNDICVSAAVT